ncbi:ARL6IP4 family protein [Megaselia abdita]
MDEVEDKKEKKQKHSKKKSKKNKKHKKKAKKRKHSSESEAEEEDCLIPLELMSGGVRAPEKPEEYAARQKKIRRVKDEETGRVRLVKGDGEILEEIVSKKRHQEINKQATKSDGDFFKSRTTGGK